MTHAGHTPVSVGTEAKSLMREAFALAPVQNKLAENLKKLPIESDGTVSVLDAAAALGIEPKRLLGFIARNGLDDPIGNHERVYAWSCLRLAARLTAQPEGKRR